MTRLVARWTDWAGRGLEHLVLSRDRDAVTAESVVIGGDALAARYRIVCDGDWRVRAAEVGVVGGAALGLRADGEGRWTDQAGTPLGQLDGTIDIDLSMTPFTNTLPIRRLDLAPGEAADLAVAYVAFPDLALSCDPQRYTCLEPGRRYRYQSLDSDFARDIEADENALVVSYPGLFRRAL